MRLPDLPAMEDGGAEEVLDTMLFVARYDVSDLRYVDAADISADDDAEILVLPNLVHKPGEVVTMAQPIPFDEFCRYLPRRPARASSSGSSSRVKALPVGVAERMREFLPWLTDDDIKAAHEKAQRKLEDLNAKGGHDGRHLDPEDLEEEAFAKVKAAASQPSASSAVAPVAPGEAAAKAAASPSPRPTTHACSRSRDYSTTWCVDQAISGFSVATGAGFTGASRNLRRRILPRAVLGNGSLRNSTILGIL